MEFDVRSSGPQSLGALLEEPQPGVATVAQELTNEPAGMAVVDMEDPSLLGRILADEAEAFLASVHLVDLLPGEPVGSGVHFSPDCLPVLVAPGLVVLLDLLGVECGLVGLVGCALCDLAEDPHTSACSAAFSDVAAHPLLAREAESGFGLQVRFNNAVLFGDVPNALPSRPVARVSLDGDLSAPDARCRPEPLIYLREGVSISPFTACMPSDVPDGLSLDPIPFSGVLGRDGCGSAAATVAFAVLNGAALSTSASFDVSHRKDCTPC